MNSCFIKFYNKKTYDKFLKVLKDNKLFVEEKKSEAFERVFIVGNESKNVHNLDFSKYNYFLFLTSFDIVDFLEKNNLDMYLDGVSGGFDASPHFTLGSLRDDVEFKKETNKREMIKLYNTLDNDHWLSKEKRIELKDKIKSFKEIKELLTELKVDNLEDFFVKKQEILFGKNIIEIILMNDADKYINYLKERLGRK